MAKVKATSMAPLTRPPRITRSHSPNKESPKQKTRIKDVVSDSGTTRNWKVFFYASPYERSRSSLLEIGRSFPKSSVIGVREECRIREQDFGRFFYRFPEGESAADVYDRVSSFLESLWRDIDMNRLNHDPSDDLNLIIVSHGLASRVFLMKWFKWTVEQFEHLNNFSNCEFRVLQLGAGGEYRLAVYHSDEEMQGWGLLPEMIADQFSSFLPIPKSGKGNGMRNVRGP